MKTFASLLQFFTISSLIFFVLLTVYPMNTVHVTVNDFLAGEDVVLPFSPDANSHMDDVREVLGLFRVLAAVSFIAALWMFGKYGVQRTTKWLLIGVPVIIALIPWNTLFNVTHKILFPQGNWLFPPNAAILEAYPMTFFIGFGIVWGVISIITGLTLSQLKRPLA